MATGSGASNSSRIASGSVAGSTGKLPGNGGTSCGDPGPARSGKSCGGNGGGDGLFVFDMALAQIPTGYRPNALALSAS